MTATAIEFTIPGRPATKGSVAFTRGNFAKHDNPRLESWTAVAKFEARQAWGQQPTREPVILGAVFTYARPKKDFRANGELKPGAMDFPTNRSDLDKLGRALMDALTSAVYVDDAQVVELTLGKVWGESDMTTVCVTAANAEEPKKSNRICPECHSDAKHHTAGCDMVIGRRGWRQLGVYDG